MSAFGGRFEAEVGFVPAGGQLRADAPLDPDLEGGAYRVIQEALTNAVRHSGGETVRVSVTTLEERLVIEVTDDGDGFVRDAGSTGYGLIGTSDRAPAIDSARVVHWYGGGDADSEGLT